jgi:hypothetical protein
MDTALPPLPPPPPYGLLITELRTKPPHMSMSEAARRAPLSLTRWRHLEHGYRSFKGAWYAEWAPAGTLARMARVVGATPDQLRERDRDDAAAELEALLAHPALSEDQRRALGRRIGDINDEPGRT